MSDARWNDPREALMRDLDLPRGDENRTAATAPRFSYAL